MVSRIDCRFRCSLAGNHKRRRSCAVDRFAPSASHYLVARCSSAAIASSDRRGDMPDAVSLRLGAELAPWSCMAHVRAVGSSERRLRQPAKLMRKAESSSRFGSSWSRTIGSPRCQSQARSRRLSSSNLCRLSETREADTSNGVRGGGSVPWNL